MSFKNSDATINFKFSDLQSGSVVLDSVSETSNQSIDSVLNKSEHNATDSLPELIENPDSLSIDSAAIKLLTPNDSLSSDSIKSTQINAAIVRQNAEVGKPIIKTQSDWMVGVSLFVIILIAIIRFSFGKYMQRLIDSILNYQTSNNLFLEKNMRNLRGSIFLNALFFVNAAFFAVLYFNYFFVAPGTETSFLIFLYSLVGLLLIYFGKFVVIRTLGYIFDGVKEGKEYIHTVFIYNKNLAIFLLPITLSVPFIADFAANFLLNTGLVISLIFYLFRLFRGIKILFRKHVSIFYMILYLCALEILPLLVIYKLLKSFV